MVIRRVSPQWKTWQCFWGRTMGFTWTSSANAVRACNSCERRCGVSPASCLLKCQLVKVPSPVSGSWRTREKGSFQWWNLSLWLIKTFIMRLSFQSAPAVWVSVCLPATRVAVCEVHRYFICIKLLTLRGQQTQLPQKLSSCRAEG